MNRTEQVLPIDLFALSWFQVHEIGVKALIRAEFEGPAAVHGPDRCGVGPALSIGRFRSRPATRER